MISIYIFIFVDALKNSLVKVYNCIGQMSYNYIARMSYLKGLPYHFKYKIISLNV